MTCNRLIILLLIIVLPLGLGILMWGTVQPASAPLTMAWTGAAQFAPDEPQKARTEGSPDASAAAAHPAPNNPAPPQKETPRRETITLIAAGDILMHNTEIWSGKQADGSYKFDFFGPVQSLLACGDYASVDFEAPLAGPQSGYTGYPLFNSPDAIAAALRETGFNLVVTANNHVLDRGMTGALRTLQVLRGAGLDTLGVYASQEAADSFLIKDIEGIKVGYLAYTYGTNGIPVPADYPYLINLLDKQRVLADIARMRPRVDFLVLILHWGNEYQVEPTDEQKTLASDFLTAGADAILGSHPHVVGPLQVVRTGEDAKVVAYSIGNFIGDQNGAERNSSAILQLKVTKDFGKNKTYLSALSYTPTFSQGYYKNGRKMFRVIPVAAGIQNIRQGQDPLLTEKDLPVLEQVYSSTTRLLGPGYMRAAE